MRNTKILVLTALIIPFLLSGILAQARANELNLNNVDWHLIIDNFPLNANLGVAESPDYSSDIEGCKIAKKFYIFEDNYQSEVVVALCDEGAFGPNNAQATIDNLVKHAQQQFPEEKSDPLTKLLLSGLPGIPVTLGEKRKGLALTIPFSGHGIAMVPMAYAIDEERKITVLVQGFIDPNNSRNLTAPIATLLQAIDRRLHENK